MLLERGKGWAASCHEGMWQGCRRCSDPQEILNYQSSNLIPGFAMVFAELSTLKPYHEVLYNIQNRDGTIKLGIVL